MLKRNKEADWIMTTEELIAARRAEPWREALRKSKKNTERTDLARVKMS